MILSTYYCSQTVASSNCSLLYATHAVSTTTDPFFATDRSTPLNLNLRSSGSETSVAVVNAGTHPISMDCSRSLLVCSDVSLSASLLCFLFSRARLPRTDSESFYLTRTVFDKIALNSALIRKYVYS